MAWYRVGTITAANNSTTVTGVGTTFTDPAVGINSGDSLIVGVGANLRIYEIQSVVSATSLTLATPTTLAISNSAYQIQTSVALTNQSLAKRISATMDRILSSISNWMQVLNGSGNVTITDYDGNSSSGLAWPSMTTLVNSSYRDKGAMGSTVLPNNLGNTTDYGIYQQSTNTNAVIANGYPIAKAGTLYVTKSAFGCQQMYITFQNEMYTRGLLGAFTPATPNWGAWEPQFNNKLKPDLTKDVAGILPVVSGGTGGQLPIANGGTGATTKAAAWLALATYGSTTGTAAQGNDARFDTIDGKQGGALIGSIYAKTISNATNVSGGSISSVVQNSNGAANTQFSMFSQLAAGGQRYGFLRVYQDSAYKDWYFDYNSGNAYAATAWQNSCDARIKDHITRISNPLERMRKIKGCTWIRKDDQMKGAVGIGLIAQDVLDAFSDIPEVVSHSMQGSLTVDGIEVQDPLAISPGDVSAALHHETILVLMDKIEALESKIESLTSA